MSIFVLKPLRRDAGFTLIEVVVAVFIFGVIASIVGTSLGNFLASRDRIISKQEQLRAMQKTFLFLSRDLRFAKNRVAKNEFGEPDKTSLTVNDNGLLLGFTTAYPDRQLDDLNVPRRVEWSLEDGQIHRKQYFVVDPADESRSYTQILLSDVEIARVELSVVENGRISTSKRWEEEGRLPDMLGITFKLTNDVEITRRFTLSASDKETASETVNTSPAVAPNPLNQN